MIKKLKQGFNAAAAAIGLSILVACATTKSPVPDPPPSAPSGLRTLTSGEIVLVARTVFADTIDYSDVYIKTKNLPSRSKAFNGIIRFSTHDYSDDFSRENLSKRTTFIHELEHMRQEQTGTNLIFSAIGLFIQGFYKDNKAYDYGDVTSIERFSELNIKQKAKLTGDFYAACESYPDFTSKIFKSNNCDFQRDSAKVLNDHLPQLQICPGCNEYAIV